MLNSTHRKTILIFSLALSLAVSLVALASQEDLREKLGSVYYVLGFSITGCVLLLLAGYVWDRSMMERIKALRQTGAEPVNLSTDDREDDDADQDEVIGLARNIERMARTLQQVEANYRNMVEDQVDLICRYRPDGRITFANGAYARAFARKRQEFVGTPFPLYSPGAAIGDGPYSFERELVLPDGRRTWLLWIQRPIKDATRLIEYQAVGHDITDRKEAEAALVRAKESAESADRAKSEFLAIVSHELRTPINGVIGFATMLADSPLNSDQREYVAMIQTGGHALEQLIADILDLSKIEAGKTEIETNPYALHRCVAEVCAFFAPKARDAALFLDSKIEPGVPAIINGDEARLRQILTNLIGNALKFTDRGRVTLNVSCARGELFLPGGTRHALRLFFAITDTGIGIAPDKISDLFKPFNQVDSSLHRRRGGTGLGLIISKRLCELMGGTISVESRLGEGTTFRFSVLVDYEKGDTDQPFAPQPSA
ncbi:MAG: PAS domain S-box protein [Undibacterium sp.]|nr:PAS domain S-box protein [Opitutaceae bacterium]